MKTIAIANQKGGVGKTTTAVTLGHGLAIRGHHVLLVDTDPQGQVATFLGLRQESGLFDLLIGDRPLSDVTRSASTNDHHRAHLHLIPSDKRTATAQIVLTSEGFKLDCLATALKNAKADYAIFDTSPSVGLLQEAALYASDWLIVPVAVDYPATEGLSAVLSTLKAVNGRGGQCKLLGVLPTMYDRVTRESKIVRDKLQEHLGDVVWEPIRRATIMRECSAEGVTIWEKQPNSPVAEDYDNLVREVLSYD